MPQSDFSGIITSSEAKKMLHYVTKNFYDHSSAALRIFQAIGTEWDEMTNWSDDLLNQFFPQSCTWSIPFWEQQYGILSDETLSLSVRRQKLIAKITYRAPVTPFALEQVLSSFTGFDTTVIENVAPYTFKIILSPTHDSPSYSYEQLFRLIQNSKPSHLSFNINVHTNRPFDLNLPLSCGLFCHTYIKTKLINI